MPLPPSSEPFYRARIAIDRVGLHDVPAGFRKLVAGKRLWNFERHDRQAWKSAL